MEIWKYGFMDLWKYKNIKIGKFGNKMETSWGNARVKLHSPVHFGLWIR